MISIRKSIILGLILHIIIIIIIIIITTTIIFIIEDLITLLSITCWGTFTGPRQSVGLGLVRGKKFTLSPKVKGCVLGICMIYDTFVIVLLSAPLLRCSCLKHNSLDT